LVFGITLAFGTFCPLVFGSPMQVWKWFIEAKNATVSLRYFWAARMLKRLFLSISFIKKSRNKCGLMNYFVALFFMNLSQSTLFYKYLIPLFHFSDAYPKSHGGIIQTFFSSLSHGLHQLTTFCGSMNCFLKEQHLPLSTLSISHWSVLGSFKLRKACFYFFYLLQSFCSLQTFFLRRCCIDYLFKWELPQFRLQTFLETAKDVQPY